MEGLPVISTYPRYFKNSENTTLSLIVMQNLSKFTQLKQLTLVSSKLIRLRCMKSSIRETKIHNPNYNGRSEQMPTLKCGITPKNLNAWSIILIIYL